MAKGRKKGVSYTTYIEDEVLSPYYIAVNQNSFMVCEGDKESYNVIGYFSKFDSALKRVAKCKLNHDAKRYNIKEYLAEWRNINEEFKNVVNF